MGAVTKQELNEWRRQRIQFAHADQPFSREMTQATPTPKCFFLFKLKEEEERNIYSMISVCQALCQLLISGYILHNHQCRENYYLHLTDEETAVQRR